MGRGPDLEWYKPAKSVAAALRQRPEGAVLEVGPHDYPGSNSGISLNRASAEELERTDFIDAHMAQKIVEARTALEGFRAWADLLKVPGMTVMAVAELQRSFRLDPPEDPPSETPKSTS